MLIEITIHDIFNALFKRWWIILIGIILGGAVAFAYSTFLIEPIYISRGSLYVNNKNTSNVTGTVNQNDLNVSIRLVDTYRVILKSDRFLGLVAKETGLPYSPQKLSPMVKLGGMSKTEVLEVSVSSTNPSVSQAICKAILENANDEIVRVVEAGSVKIVDDASFPTSPSSPSIPKNTVIGIAIGLLLSVIIIFIVDRLDNTVKNEEDLENKYEIPVIGSIPNLDQTSYSNANYNNRGYIYEK